MAPDTSERFLLFGAFSVKLFPVLLLPFAQDCGNRLLTVEKFWLDSYAVKLKRNAPVANAEASSKFDVAFSKYPKLFCS